MNYSQSPLKRLAVLLTITALLLTGAFFAGPLGDKAENLLQKEAHAKKANSDYHLASIVVLTRVISYINGYYYDQQRKDPQKMFKSAMEQVSRELASVMVRFDDTKKEAVVMVDTEQKTFSYGNLNTIWSVQYLLSDIFRFLQPHLESQVDPKEVEYAAINGMLDTLDPHSTHMSPPQCSNMEVSTKGKFGGLGITIGIRDGKLTIIAPIKDTPAWRAGLKAQDKIVKIDGQSTINMSLDEAVGMMRGDPDTVCKLHIMRKGFTAPKEFTIVRAIIKVSSVNSKLMAGNIGYVRLKTFHGKTTQELDEHLGKLKRQGALKGLILDLRGNPGGLLDAAIKVSDTFLDSGMIVSTVGGQNDPLDTNSATYMGTEEKYPIVVLVSPSSASASEIVAGALKNNNRAVIIGDRTFGKGSVQVIYKMDDGSCLKLTVAQYLTPGNVSIQSVGIVPDIQLSPVFIEKDTIEFHSIEKMRREQNLEQHLEHDSTITDRSFESLHYLYDEKRDDIDIDAPPDTVNTNHFAIQFAHKLLKKLGDQTTRREIMLQKSVPFLKQSRENQENRIIEEFKKIDIDWKKYSIKAEDEPVMDIAFSKALDDKPLEKPLEGGNEPYLHLKVTNKGKRPLVRLRAITDSDHYIFDGLEFFFGRLAPSETKIAKRKVQIPKDVETRTDDIIFRFYEDEGGEPNIHIEQIKTRSLPEPDFAFNYQLVETEGNKDGLMQAGEAFDMIVDLKNIGEGAVVDGLTTLKNKDNIRAINLSKGRATFDPIKPGETTKASFGFSVKKEMQRARFPMSIAIYDAELRTSLYNLINFNIASPKKITPADKPVRVKAEALVYGSPDERLPVIAKLKKARKLASLGETEGWVKVRLNEKRVGWVKAIDLQTKEAIAEEDIETITLNHWLMAPEIIIDENSAKQYTENPSVTLNITAKDDNHVLDIYILNNGKKVFYQSNKTGKNPLSMQISATIKLEEGHNHIHIVARESENLVGRENINIYRKKSMETILEEIEKASVLGAKTE